MAIARRIRPGVLAALRKGAKLTSLGRRSTDYNPHARVSCVLFGKAEWLPLTDQHMGPEFPFDLRFGTVIKFTASALNSSEYRRRVRFSHQSHPVPSVSLNWIVHFH